MRVLKTPLENTSIEIINEELREDTKGLIINRDHPKTLEDLLRSIKNNYKVNETYSKMNVNVHSQ